METSQKSKISAIPFIDYVPAEVKETTGENWRVVFYVRKPGTNEMQRFRRRVKKISNKQQRMRYAKRICANINSKLENKWTPFQDTLGKHEYQPFSEALKLFMKQGERKHKDKLMRHDTLRSYTSYVNNIKKYLKEKGRSEMFTIEFNKKFVLDFLDYIYYERKRSARTSNNYLSFLSTLSTFMVDKEFISTNPTAGIPKKKTGKKKREIIPSEIRSEIFKYWAERNQHYLTLCLTVFFCFIRRTEISLLKVKHVSLKNDTIFIPKEIAKNEKDGIVTIPKKLKKLLVFHLDKAATEDYLFSSDNFKPGRERLAPKKISDTWGKMKRELEIKDEYQFYSLKDTGITQLFYFGIPTIKIRDQARHHDIKITESYAPRNYVADDLLKDLDHDF